MRTTTTCAVIGLAGAAMACEAGPLEWRLVPRDAGWVAHVDVERLASSRLAAALCEEAAEEEDFEELRALGIEPMEDVFSVTAYGWGSIEDERIVIVVDGTEDLVAGLEKAMEMEAEEIERTERDGRVYYHVHEGDERHAIGVVDREGGVRLILAGTMDGVDEAGAVRERERARVVEEGPGEGSLVYVSVLDVGDVVPKMGGEHGHAQLVEATEGMVIEIAESGDRIKGRLLASIADTQTTQDAADMMQGLLAMGRMMMRDNEDLRPVAELAGDIRIGARESKLEITLDTPVELLERVLAAHREHEGHGHEERD